MIKALAITGPTASGKTTLSIDVAVALNCEIICMDSMQIYRGMDIGTAKATVMERAAVPHHCIDFLSPRESFSAHAYKEMARSCAEDITSRGKLPLFVGGTGLYLSTLLRPDCEEPPESSREFRESIEATLLTEEDRRALWQRLRDVDPMSAEAIHHNNTRRVIRAIEIFETTGKTKSYFDELTRIAPKDFSIAHLTFDFHSRDTLYKRIDRRVDEMMADGLANEVISLFDKGLLPPDSTAAQAIGYKEIIEARQSGLPLSWAAETIKQSSRNYAKRQLTWFRNSAKATPLFADTEDGDMRSYTDILAEAIAFFRNYNFK